MARTGEERITFIRCFNGEPEGKSPRRRHTRRCITYQSESWIGCVGVDWVNRAEDRDKWRADVNTARNVTGYVIFGMCLVLLLKKNSATWS
jgi:hypothetical protein